MDDKKTQEAIDPTDLIEELGSVLVNRAVPYETAAFAFGVLMKSMVDKAVKGGAPLPVALNRYFAHFMSGMEGHLMGVAPVEGAPTPPGRLLQ